MLLCKECRKTIANAGNPTIHYSTCIDCGKQKEKEQTISPICKNCEYLGRCLTEHYQYVSDLKNGCNGYRYLLDTYQFRYGK